MSVLIVNSLNGALDTADVCTLSVSFHQLLLRNKLCSGLFKLVVIKIERYILNCNVIEIWLSKLVTEFYMIPSTWL